MGNATPALLDVADLVTADADHDGILLSFRDSASSDGATSASWRRCCG